MKLHIPNPCQEDWSQMLPEEQGRYCMACSKTVVDFTSWEPGAIRDYMLKRSGEKVCGRFMSHQLNTSLKQDALNWPELIAASGLSWFKKVAAIIVVVFGLATSSCNTGPGEVELTGDTVYTASVKARDTTQAILPVTKNEKSNVVDSAKCVKGKKVGVASEGLVLTFDERLLKELTSVGDSASSVSDFPVSFVGFTTVTDTPQVSVRRKKTIQAQVKELVLTVAGNVKIDTLNAKVNRLMEEVEKQRGRIDSDTTSL